MKRAGVQGQQILLESMNISLTLAIISTTAATMIDSADTDVLVYSVV